MEWTDPRGTQCVKIHTCHTEAVHSYVPRPPLTLPCGLPLCTFFITSSREKNLFISGDIYLYICAFHLSPNNPVAGWKTTDFTLTLAPVDFCLWSFCCFTVFSPYFDIYISSEVKCSYRSFDTCLYRSNISELLRFDGIKQMERSLWSFGQTSA